MTIQECYAALGGDYEDVIGRLRSERLVQKFVLKFPDDGSYRLLLSSLEEGNDAEAFRAAHTIKGMCQNLSFTRLANSSSELTEALRRGDREAALALLPQVKEDYERTTAAIAGFKAAIPL